jgi:2-oxoglutarate/2-oxoacid ferredoxin oxidoreductase subunit beta
MTIDLGMPATGESGSGESGSELSGLHGVPQLRDGDPKQTRKDFASDSEVRWCPGCGDYAILAAVQGFMPELGLRKENIVCISGIGCAARFPYYLDTFGLHSIHGRAPSIATGLAVSRPDLSVWVVTGDGDALSIGGNHLIHALRRNVNLTIMLFNNRIYGLTKGQYSPTSLPGAVTKSTPVGSVDGPFNPVSLALGAEAGFVARTMDSDRAHLTSVLRQAAEYRGASLVEIYQNCPIFNDGEFDVLKDRDSGQARMIRLEHGRPIRFGPPGEDGQGTLGVIRGRGTGLLELAPVAEVGAEAVLVHDAADPDPSLAFALSRLDDPTMAHVPFGVFRSVSRPTYDDLVREQTASASADGPPSDHDLAALLAGSDTWTVA